MARRKIWIIATMLAASVASGLAFAQFDRRHATRHRISEMEPIVAGNTREPITPLPLTVALDQRKVELGRKLFHEPAISADGTVSCATCHNLANGGVDRLPRSRGIGGKIGTINAPTVFNSGFNFRQFWNGRAESLEDQVDGPVRNPIEMASSWPQAIAALERDRQYRKAFSSIYPDGIQPHNVRDAIATFERSLITPNSRFDRSLRGDKAALDEKEQAGYRLFRQVGCISCHQGVNIGGNLYQKLGIMEDYFAARGHITPTDMGLFNVTGREADRHYFKVPSLRNVALTPPYLHDGSALTLEDAIKVMARYQLGKELNAGDVSSISAFLKTLTGEYQGKPLE